MQGITISDLRERPDFFDTVADRIWRAWWEQRGVTLEHITARLSEHLHPVSLPVALVAHLGDEFVGTASVIISDMDERPHYSPWIAALWLEPSFRGAGIAPRLIERAADIAFGLGHKRVYLSSAPVLEDYYRSLNFQLVEQGVGVQRLTVYLRERDLLGG